MGKLIPQHEREKQIRDLCEGTIYSFAGWEGEYRNNRSKLMVQCEKHSVRSVTVSDFLMGKGRCKQCYIEKMRNKFVRTEPETIKLLIEKGFYFVRWKDSYVNQYSVAIFHCEKHGEYEKDVAHALFRGTGCQKCSGLYRHSRDEREKQIVDKNKNYVFLGWVDEYKNNTSRIKMQCDVGHKWEVSLGSYIDKSIGCPRCGGTGKYDEVELLQMLQQSLGEGKTFIKWVGEFGVQSKAVFECSLHGQWLTTASSILHQRSNCPDCSVSGYKPNQSGTLYCLRSTCGQFVKVGISNDHERRLSQLRRNTPFDFGVIETLTHDDGSKIREWEKIFHESFVSAGLTGFDGCTEWLKWDAQIPAWFRFLK